MWNLPRSGIKPVSCTDRMILNHWITRGIPNHGFWAVKFCSCRQFTVKENQELEYIRINVLKYNTHLTALSLHFVKILLSCHKVVAYQLTEQPLYIGLNLRSTNLLTVCDLGKTVSLCSSFFLCKMGMLLLLPLYNYSHYSHKYLPLM